MKGMILGQAVPAQNGANSPTLERRLAAMEARLDGFQETLEGIRLLLQEVVASSKVVKSKGGKGGKASE